jgi:hypothetical protein
VRLSALYLSVLFILGAGSSFAAADDLEDAFQRLKDAQAKNDAPAVKKAAAELHGLACAVLSAPEPVAGAEKELWANRVEYARSASESSEYALYAAGIRQQPPALIEWISSLEQLNPKSKYLDQAYGLYLVALSKTAGGPKATAAAEKALANFPENEDLLLYLLTASGQKQSDRALNYGNRLLAVVNRHPRPQTLAAADWERKRNYALTQGYWTVGVICAEKGQYLNADKNLRAALPLVKDNEAMLAPALFHLGMVNYQLAKMTMNKARILEAARFSEQAAAIDGPYMDQARHNALVMKAEAAKMR